MKQNAVVCWPEPMLLFFIFSFEYLISGPKSYRDFQETGPRSPKKIFRFGLKVKGVGGGGPADPSPGSTTVKRGSI